MSKLISMTAAMTCLAITASAGNDTPHWSLTWKKMQTTGPELELVGALPTRTTHELGASDWSVGCETLDRDYADFDSYKPYLSELGVTSARIQSGWARCEKQKGRYDFAWIDHIVDGMLEEGVQPWINLGYGNPLYGAEKGLGSKIFTDEPTMKAWLKFVETIVARYRNKVHEWEIWNEPNLGENRTNYDAYASLLSHTVETIRRVQPDAVIIGPTFVHETQELCKRLDAANIPYIFVDSVIPDTHPVATFTTDHYTCGFLLGKLLLSMSAKEGFVAILGAQRTGNERASTSLERRRGFRDYMARSGLTDRIREASFSVLNPEENEKSIMEFIQANRDIRGIAVMNSRGYIIADILRKKGINDIIIISFDLTSNNTRCIKNGSITALLCQRPELQGFNAIKEMIQHLIYKQEGKGNHYTMPIDIVMQENLPYYK